MIGVEAETLTVALNGLFQRLDEINNEHIESIYLVYIITTRGIPPAPALSELPTTSQSLAAWLCNVLTRRLEGELDTMDTLNEVRQVYQRPGEDWRRWFASVSSDLFVWSDDKGISAFEFCYDKQRDEHALRWRRDARARHLCVDDGECAGRHKMSPLVMPNGDFDPEFVAGLFELVAADIDPPVYRFVRSKLSEITGLHSAL